MFAAWMLLIVVVTAFPFTTARVRSGKQATDDPRACPWDIKLCVDGTWVYRLPEKQCEFPKCWVRFVDPPAPTIGNQEYDGAPVGVDTRPSDVLQTHRRRRLNEPSEA